MDISNQYGTLQLQQSLLILLKDFCLFCEINNIKYSLAYGSLLGAVRHKGFIPWDDDLDVIVTRDEFEKIKIKIKEQSKLQFNYQTQTSMWIAKVTEDGLTNELFPPTLDIFVLDNVPNNLVNRYIKLFLVYMIQGMVKYKLTLRKGGLLMKLCAFFTYIFGQFLSQSFKWKLYECISQISNNRETKYAGIYNSIYEYIHKIVSRDIMDEYIQVPFEDTNVSIMKGYDEFLKVHYGNYMELPEDKRGHHIHPDVSIKY